MPAIADSLVRRATQDRPESPAIRAQQDHRDNSDFRAPVVRLEGREARVSKVSAASKDPWDLPVLRGSPEALVSLETPDHKELLEGGVQMDSRDSVVILVRLELVDLLEAPDQLEQSDFLDCPDHLVIFHFVSCHTHQFTCLLPGKHLICISRSYHK